MIAGEVLQLQVWRRVEERNYRGQKMHIFIGLLENLDRSSGLKES